MESRCAMAAVAALLAGCAFNVTLMPRDSGTTYTGHMEGSGGTGTLSIAMDARSCTGPVAKVASGETFGFANTFGTAGGRSFAGLSTMATAGDSQFKAILSCNDGTGLRCDLTSTGGAGGGICLDDKGRVYDALVTRK